MQYNQNSGYGKDLVQQVGALSQTGKIFYVSSVTTGAIVDMLKQIVIPDPDGVIRYHSTIASALALCVASRGDTIIVMPGHTETITGAAGITASVAGVSIIGIGNGSLRPNISFTTAITAQMVVSGANITFKNMVFTVGFDAITAMISVTGAYVKFLECEFVTNNATMGAVLGILTAATATGFTVDGCRFIGPATNSGTTTTAQIKHEVGTDYVIKNSYFTGKMTQAILNATTVLRGLIDNNRFVIATGTKAIAMEASSTPFITNNNINVPSGTAPIVCAAGFMSRNNYSAAAGVTAGTASTF